AEVADENTTIATHGSEQERPKVAAAEKDYSVTLREALEAYQFVDDEYQDSNRSLSPTNTWCSSSEAADDDFSITPDDPLEEYEDLLETGFVDPTDRPFKLCPRGLSHWPSDEVWHGEGHLMALGRDLRQPAPDQEGTRIITLLCDVPMCFHREHELASVSSDAFLQCLLETVALLQGDVYIEVPLEVEGESFWRMIAYIDSDKKIVQHEETDIELQAIGRQDTSTILRRVKFAMVYRLVPVISGAPPVKHAWSDSAEEDLPEAKRLSVPAPAGARVLAHEGRVTRSEGRKVQIKLPQKLKVTQPPVPTASRPRALSSRHVIEDSDSDIEIIEPPPKGPKPDGSRPATAAAALLRSKLTAQQKASKYAREHIADDDSDVQIVDGPSGSGTPADDAKMLRERTQEADAILSWLNTTQDGMWAKLDGVIAIRTSRNRRAARTLDELLETVATVSMIKNIGKTDNRAAPPGRNKNCVDCQAILENVHGERILRKIKGMRSPPLGVKRLLEHLQATYNAKYGGSRGDEEGEGWSSEDEDGDGEYEDDEEEEEY
ncbi:hypothetical protein OH76DRAFT_1490635, partial [Lentinus brumalis]